MKKVASTIKKVVPIYKKVTLNNNGEAGSMPPRGQTTFLLYQQQKGCLRLLFYTAE
jgi:hypothetical protein